MVIKLKLGLAPPIISGAMAVALVVDHSAPVMKVNSSNPAEKSFYGLLQYISS